MVYEFRKNNFVQIKKEKEPRVLHDSFPFEYKEKIVLPGYVEQS